MKYNANLMKSEQVVVQTANRLGHFSAKLVNCSFYFFSAGWQTVTEYYWLLDFWL